MNSNKVTKGLLYGGISSCIAETFTMPVDVVKTRLQMDGTQGHLYKGPWDCAKQLVRSEGRGALFKGLPPALVRQSTYGSLRYGMYGPIRNALGARDDTTTTIPLWKKVLAGGSSGAMASAVANPTDLIKVRLQTDGQIKGADGEFLPKKYRGMIHALRSIIREEGIRGLWKGVGPTVGRATVLAAVELSTYDQVKEQLLQRQLVQEGLLCTVCTAAVSGYLSTVASSPLDVVKSRVMGQPLHPDGTGQLYRGMVHCFVSSVQKEGLSSLYNGFWPNFGRIVPRVVLVFIVMEKLKTWFG